MPAVKKGESKDSYMGRCMPVCIGEGLTKSQAAGKCLGMWAQSQKKKHSNGGTIDEKFPRKDMGYLGEK